MENDEWFIWERQARLHSLFLPLEAAMEPLRKYFGYSLPDTTVIFQGSIVKWLNRMEPLKALGRKMIDFYSVAQNLQKFESDLEAEQEKLEAIFRKIDSMQFNSLEDRELFNVYSQFRKQYLAWYRLGWLVEPISMASEDCLREIGVDRRKISIITLPAKDSFSKRELKDMLSIAARKKEGENAESLLDEHATKYFWARNSYYSTQVLGKEYFKKELVDILAKYPDSAKYLSELERADNEALEKKKALISGLALGEKEMALVELVSCFVWVQDYRKEHIMRANHYLDLLLNEIGRRKGFSKIEMAYTLPRDMPKIADGLLKKSDLKARMKNCLIIWKEFHDDYLIFTGAEAQRRAKQVFAERAFAHGLLEIQGLSANTGRRTGRAFVTMSPKEAEKLTAGDILVTSMTSPDFIEGMRKAAAIATDEGGITSHAAILARELGVPCVVGTKIATKAIKTGDRIEVDGNHGFVRKLEN